MKNISRSLGRGVLVGTGEGKGFLLFLGEIAESLPVAGGKGHKSIHSSLFSRERGYARKKYFWKGCKKKRREQQMLLAVQTLIAGNSNIFT